MISQKTKLTLNYLAGGAIIVLGTILLVATARGWKFDIFTGQISETGLVIINSDPNGATVSINGKPTNNKTPYRLVNVDPGDMSVDLKKPGFRDWHTKFTVKPEVVSFADYAWLLPTTISTRKLFDDQQITSDLQSNDFRHIAITTTPSRPTIAIIDSIQNSPSTIYQSPVATDTTQAVTSLDIVAFNQNNSKLLVRQTTPSGTDYLVLNTNSNQEPTQLGKSFGIHPDIIGFGPNPNDIFYVEKGILRKINLDNNTTSEILAENVSFAKVSDTRLYYVQKSPPNKTSDLWVLDSSGTNKSRILADIIDSPAYDLDYNRYNGRDYLAFWVGADKSLWMIVSVFDNPKASVISHGAANFTFNKSGRYLVINQSGSMRTLDFEFGNRYNAGTKLDDLKSWQWVSDEHLAVLTGTSLRLIDFTGENDETLATNAAYIGPVMVGPDRSLLNLFKNTSSSSIQQIFLTPQS